MRPRPSAKSPSLLRHLIVLLCITVVMLRVGGGHLHLCLDGSEPPVALHLTEDGSFHEETATPEQSAGHTDLDLQLTPGAGLLAKSPLPLDGDVTVALLAALLLCCLIRPRRLVSPAHQVPQKASRIHFLLPPRQARPTLLSC